MKKPVEVYILSGFLGSGKTTVLKKMVEECKKNNQQLGIILNELGDTNVENHLFENEQMYELLNGCICCSIQDDLKSTLDQFIQKPVDVLLIEGTGVANPAEIVEALASPMYIEQFALRSIISLVDASNYLDYQSIFSSSKEIRTLLKEQITSASLIILNKTDLVTDKKLEKITTQVRKQISADTPIIYSSFGEVVAGELLKIRTQMLNLMNEESKACGCSSTCHHNHVNHAAIKAIKLEDVPQVDRKDFEKWLKQLPIEVLRGKGIIQFKNDSIVYSFQYASKKLFLDEVNVNQDPVIILIGNKLHIETIRASYEQTFLNISR